MVFVTIGTSEPFDRLMAVIDGIRDPDLVVQCADSKGAPARARTFDYLPYDDLVQMIREADVVVAHAGVGTILTVLHEGKRPVVVTRLKRHGEAIDDHQVPIARRLAEAGIVSLVEDLGLLPDAVDAARGVAAPAASGRSPLADDLGAYLTGILGPRHAARSAS